MLEQRTCGTWTRLMGVALAIVGCLAGVSRAQNPETPLKPVVMPRLQPGLQIGRSAPQGWSHLVWLARPRLASGDIDKVPSIVGDYTGKFTMAVAANVVERDVQGQASFALEKIAIGLGTDINGRHVIVNSETQQQLGANLGIIGSRSLEATEKGLDDTFLMVQTPTMAVFDARHVCALYQGDHHYMTVRNVVLVSARGGGMATLSWLMGQDKDDNYFLAEKNLYFVPPNHRENRLINVKADKFVLGIPTPDAFAVVKIAQGRPLPFSDAVRPLATLPQFSAKTAKQLEVELWKVLVSGNLTSQNNSGGATSPR